MSRVLVIDDQKDVRAMICMVLRLNHFEAVEADSAKTALKAFAESDFEAAVVDIFLEDTNGFDLIAAMRERVPDLPIVAVSGMATLDAVAPSSELPNLVCLQKPFRPVELVRAIETARAAARIGEVGTNKNAPAGPGRLIASG